MKIAVVDLGYYGASIDTLLVKQHEIVAVDVQASWVEAINDRAYLPGI